ncbi:DUF3592 domain-containing protein [Corynebacterium striatum]|uniref:DUF3592 domain-containing protein n=1 Tax=Corynebacterium striatum TaxID=43770 RepID=UPI000D75894D|nr:DUF3592 domain-containing protein [Corynebacterium striatum]PXY03776.1 DUF3592 domain-containing protein [Corynebacterium striatum]
MTPKAAVVPRYTPAVYRRRLHQLIIALYVASLVGMLGMIVGAFLNDRSIESNPGRALATVTDVGITRTSVDFQDNKGIYHSPQSGLLYPTGLGEGQQVWVLYSRANPDLVKVEGREWTLSLIPALSSMFVASLIAAGAWWTVGVSTRAAERRMQINENVNQDFPQASPESTVE